MNITVNTAGTGVIGDDKLSALPAEHFDLRPKGIIEMLDLPPLLQQDRRLWPLWPRRARLHLGAYRRCSCAAGGFGPVIRGGLTTTSVFLQVQAVAFAEQLTGKDFDFHAHGHGLARRQTTAVGKCVNHPLMPPQNVQGLAVTAGANELD
jgi:hypothetical protein